MARKKKKHSHAKERLARKRGACKREAPTERRRKEETWEETRRGSWTSRGHPRASHVEISRPILFVHFPLLLYINSSTPLRRSHSRHHFPPKSTFSSSFPSLIDFALCVQGHRICLGRCNNTESTMVSFSYPNSVSREIHMFGVSRC
jgi:hypothetical protein